MSLAARLGLSQAPVYLMDGTAFLFRSFYAGGNMQNSDGIPTGAVYILTRLLLKILKSEEPAYFAFIMDGKGPHFRHELFPAYKAQRSATPEDLISQIEPARELVMALGLRLIVSENCEADDCIASLAGRFQDERPVVIVGADKDLKQCLTPNVLLWDPAARDEKITTLEDFERETGLTPAQWPDFQAVIGDSSDNIPGVPGVGPKTAAKIFADMPDLESIEAGLDSLPPKLQEKFRNSMQQVFIYRQLTRLSTNCCPELSLTDLTPARPDLNHLAELFEKFELFSLMGPARQLAARFAAAPAAKARTGKGPARQSGSAAPAAPTDAANNAVPPNALKHTAETGTAPETVTPASLNPDDFDIGPRSPENPGSNEQPLTPGTSASAASVPPAASATPNPASVPGHSAASGVRPPQTEQMSLFGANDASDDPFAGLDAPAPLPLQPDALPDLSGAEVAVVYEQGKWQIAFEGNSYALSRPTGAPAPAASTGEPIAPGSDNDFPPKPPQALLTALERADCVIAPDVKALLLSDDAWQRVERWFDLGLAAYLLNPEERDYAWPHLAGRFAHNVGISPRSPALLALGMKKLLAPRLEQAGLRPLLQKLEQPLIPVLAAMQKRGIRLDLDAFAAFLQEVQAELEQLTAKIYTQAGESFNIRSSQQLQHLLFDKLGLPKAGKTKSGALSTSQEALEKLAGKHEIIDTILEFRKLEKMRSTYLEPLPQLVDRNGRVHTSFNQLATATGRLSSSNPNLQNIPIRGELGSRMRSCFVASPGNVLISADYSQIELRVLAHLSQDPALLLAFRNGEDIHSSTAALLFEKPREDISPDERRNAKTINFGIIYGMGAQKLARELKISMKEAKDFITRYYEKLSTLKTYYDQIIQRATTDGFVTTMAGRRRFIPDISSANAQALSQAKRQAVNTVIQGSAADIIKIAMLTVNNDSILHSLGARLILQVHDELVVETPEAAAREAGARLARIMSEVSVNGVTLSVPLLVEWGMAANWDAAH